MNITPVEMLQKGGITLGVGILMGIFDDSLSLLFIKIRPATPKHIYLKNLKDAIFIISFTICGILTIYYNCNGKLRWIFVFILIIGLLTNKLLFSKTVSKLLELLYKSIIKIIKLLYLFFIKPIEKISKRMYNITKKLRYLVRSEKNEYGKKKKKT